MNNYSIPSVSFKPLQNNQRTHKHLRKKTIRQSKRKLYADGKSDEFFLLMGDDESEDEIFLNDLGNLRNRQVNSSNNCSLDNAKTRKHSYSDPFLNCDFITIELQKSDTLQRISVKYGCSISDLKRANNLISNQEFYGLRHLKIPVKKYSLLTEMMPADNNELSERRVENKESSDDSRTVSVGIGPMLSSNSTEEAAAFLKRMDQDLMKIMLNTQSQKGSLEEVTAALSESRFHPLVKDACTNVDGIHWSYLLIFILLVAIIIPVCIVLYMYYIKPSNHTNHHELLYNGNSTIISFNTTLKTNDFSKS